MVMFRASLLLSALFIFGCRGTIPQASGDIYTITFITGSSASDSLKAHVRSVFEKKIFTPQEEQLFYCSFISFDSLQVYQFSRTIVLLASPEGKEPVDSFFNKAFTSEALQRLKNVPGTVAVKKNLWAEGQSVFFGIIPDSVDIKVFDSVSVALKYEIEKSISEYLLSAVLKIEQENTALEQHTLNASGWMIFVPKDAVLAREDSSPQFYWIRHSRNSDMEKWLFAASYPDSVSSLFIPDSLLAERNRLTKKYYRSTNDSDYVSTGSFPAQNFEYSFNGRNALKVYGTWEMSDKYMGGPFLSYVFYDRGLNRTFFLDGSVFAPGFAKRNLIQLIDVQLQTFRTQNELSEIGKLP